MHVLEKLIAYGALPITVSGSVKDSLAMLKIQIQTMYWIAKLLFYMCVSIMIFLYLPTDSKGYLVDEDGFDFMKLSFLRDIKAQHRTLRFVSPFENIFTLIVLYLLNIFKISRDYSKTYARAKYYDEAKPWNERCDVAFPCASQNEIDHSDAISLVNLGCRILVEGGESFFFLFCLSFCYFFL